MSLIFDEIKATGERMGAQQERFRIARLIGDLPGEKCECAAWTVEAGWHSPDCHQAAVEQFRNRVTEALFSPIPAAASDAFGVSCPASEGGTSGAAAATAL